MPVSSSLEICDLAQTVLDVIAALFWQFVAATGGLVVVLFYLVAQMIGAGKVIELLFGVNHVVAVAGIGC